MEKLAAQSKQLTQAINRLAEVLDMPLDEAGTVRDSAIQRFEFCVDLSWKTIKTKLLDEHGVTCASPKSCFREAVSVGLLPTDDPFWFTLIELRNLSAHTYNEDLANELYAQLPQALERFQSLCTQM